MQYLSTAILNSCFLFILSFIVLLNAPAQAAYKIGILIQKENTATYEETLSGFFKKLGPELSKYTFIQKNAKQDKSQMLEISRSFAKDPSVNLLLIMGSSAVTIANREVKTKPVLFGGINHPRGLGIKGKNITGTTYYVKPSAIVNLAKRLNPFLNKVGILYEPASQNAASSIEVPEIRQALNNLQIDLIEGLVKNKGDIDARTEFLVKSGAQFIILPTNALLYNNVAQIRKICDPAKVALISFTRKGVVNGALIGLTSDNFSLGQKLAEMLTDIIENNKKPSSINWYFPASYKIMINSKTQTKLKSQIPESLSTIAVHVK